MGIFQEELIRTLHNVFYKYLERKEEKYLIRGERVRLVRGTITSVAHFFEDEIGRILYKVLAPDYSILVDYPISFPGKNNRITPDILIIRDKTIIMILELKIDLGYEQINWREKRAEVLSKISSFKNEMYYKEVINGKKESSKLSAIDNVPYGTIILSQKNGGIKSRDIINECVEKKCHSGEIVPYFHLLQDKSWHPNDFISTEQVDQYFNELINDYLDNEMQDAITQDWKRLENFLRKHLEFQ
ncbi:hypothetical protein DS745_11160 [Anaerobacillus alkaliphilus]|uniref:Uncharacterized protein n=1 Tax=Anaerobacillus alkaliphilus TaxID=1548597 RepID=A0A4Q0VV64_9BACI|nr:hypothetical protein [Anaerobacillus alkaliphilus]RXJ00617.1 hypothetical protein DS745_11160 [Anaerobacillus alkaliphilus]